MQLFGHEAEEYFQVQFPVYGTNNPFGVMFNGPKATSKAQNPRFKVLEIDNIHLIP